MNNKCSCYTKRNRKCKNSPNIFINDKYYCYSHIKFQKEYKSALIIQSYWQINKKKNKFKLYCNLPDDIQYIIKKKVNSESIMEKLIKNFLRNKINIIKNFDFTAENITKNIYYLYDIYSYIYKYKFIDEFSIKKIMPKTKILSEICEYINITNNNYMWWNDNNSDNIYMKISYQLEDLKLWYFQLYYL
jgi:hypothetical protein